MAQQFLDPGARTALEKEISALALHAPAGVAPKEMPNFKQRAEASDKYAAGATWHSPDPRYSFLALYSVAYRSMSTSVHPTLVPLQAMVHKQVDRWRYRIGRPTLQNPSAFRIAPPLFGNALMCASDRVSWLDQSSIEAIFAQDGGGVNG